MHGGYGDAWCWEPYFLPWFAAQGWPAHALSLRGHGTSGGADTLYIAGLDDYVADVEHVAARFAAPPVLIGHSMGAAVIERMMATPSGARRRADRARAADRAPAGRHAPRHDASRLHVAHDRARSDASCRATS